MCMSPVVHIMIPKCTYTLIILKICIDYHHRLVNTPFFVISISITSTAFLDDHELDGLKLSNIYLEIVFKIVLDYTNRLRVSSRLWIFSTRRPSCVPV